MILPTFPYSINYCPPTRTNPEGSMLIEARIGTRTVRRRVGCSAYSAMQEEAWLGSHVQYLLSKIYESREFLEATVVSRKLADAQAS